MNTRLLQSHIRENYGSEANKYGRNMREIKEIRRKTVIFSATDSLHKKKGKKLIGKSRIRRRKQSFKQFSFVVTHIKRTPFESFVILGRRNIAE